MFEVGDAVLLPSEFGSAKKGVLARKEPNGVWLVQIGTTGFAFLPEKVLRPLSRLTTCRDCGTQLDLHTCVENMENSYRCPVCGASNCRKQQEKE